MNQPKKVCKVSGCDDRSMGSAIYTWTPPWPGGERVQGESEMCQLHLANWNMLGFNKPERPKLPSTTTLSGEAALSRMREIGVPPSMIEAAQEHLGAPDEDSSYVFDRSDDV